MKSDVRQVSPDTHRPILYHVMYFVQRARAKTNRWMIIVYTSG